MLFENKTNFVTGGTGSFSPVFLPIFFKMTEAQQDNVVHVLGDTLGINK